LKTTPVIPRTSFGPSAVMADGWICQQAVKHGGAGQVVGRVGSTPRFRAKKLIRFVKFAGSDLHQFPEELAEIGQLAADHQYRVSRFAREKTCLLVCRRVALAGTARLVGDVCHAHSFGKQGRMLGLAAFAGALVKQGALKPSLLSLSVDLFLNEYVYTNCEPSFFQAARAPEDLDVRMARWGMVPVDERRLPMTRAADNTVVFLTSQVFHRAPRREELAAGSLGQERIFVDVMYFGSRDVERQLGRVPVVHDIPEATGERELTVNER